jgi:hypothetical protein
VATTKKEYEAKYPEKAAEEKAAAKVVILANIICVFSKSGSD